MKNDPLKSIEPEIITIRKWASSKTIVRKVYIFGSRACGQFHHESDLDVAIEIDPRKGDTNSFTTWTCEAKKWKEELQPFLRYNLDLERYDPKETPTVHKGIKKCNIIIYER